MPRKLFENGFDPRRNTTGKNKGHGKGDKKVRLTDELIVFLNSPASDKELYKDKFTRAGVLRAIARSDTLWKEIIERIDGKVATPIEHSGQITIAQLLDYARNKRNNGADASTGGATTG